LALLLALHGPPVRAQPGAPEPPARLFAIEWQPLPLPAAVAIVAPPRGGLAGALDDAALAAWRGGTDTPWSAPWSDMKLNGTVDHNSASQIVTGANIVTDGAFSNASGLPMVIQNSGANVLIQSATIVNVQFR
jgi:hypothetical protein